MQWPSHQRLRRAAGVGAAVGMLGLVLSLVPRVLEVDQTLGLGLLYWLRGSVAAPDSVAIVAISKESAKAMGQSEHLTDWSRSLHADLVDELRSAGARAIVFDLLFQDPHDAAGDRRFADAIRAAGNVVLLERFDRKRLSEEDDWRAGALDGILETRTPPSAQFADGALAIAPFTLPVVPFDVNQFWTFGRVGSGTPSLPVVALQAHLLDDYDALRALLVAGAPQLDTALPRTRADLGAPEGLADVMSTIRAAFEADPSLLPRSRERLDAASSESAFAARLGLLVDLYGGMSSRYLNYYGPARTIRTIPYESVVANRATLDVAGKTVFVGYSDRQTRQSDFFHSVFSERTGSNLSGVEIGATAFANMLEQRSLVPLGRLPHLLTVLLWGFGLGVLLSLQRTSRAGGLAVLAAAGGLALAYWAFASYSLWLPLLVPIGVQVPIALAAVFFANYRELAKHRRRIEVALGYYVPAAEVRRLANTAASIRSDNRLLHGTCLYTDAEQYTTVAEALPPEELAALMNDYYRVMFEVVGRHEGFVSDTAGDAMVAVWATATPDPESSARACRAALEILDAVAEFNRRRARRLPTRVGLDAGELLLGSFGAEQRLEYRAIGDIVNTASRIQGLNRVLGTGVLVSEAALDGPVEGLSARRRDVGTFLLRGKTKPVRLYELLRIGDGGEGPGFAFETFEATLARFRAGDWSAAAHGFADLARSFPEDGPSRYYAGLSAGFVRRPPPYWDGAIRIEIK